ncbi:hypothetical protein FNV65_06255 [Streptomyces sp. S1A1-8]|uniref:hypothetical protein n=1 Tax=unclassified Streptomyces TaxID=2593676 RepID=UPI00116561A2|nr:MULTISPECIES: hypothetical protein [unclassified Streptomyces]QDN75754.1 hypothetical protein FNV64_09240 [Streptomyces sp. S1A1-7]QDN95963.1 hypothetical protein FNV58_07685 [Streptomyces sp. RLB1-9]QDO06254.1 hypothetical protein FNV68_08250 [Streptomyces sp. S1D4-23]QDO17686.1 hypothetical protein FNV65_06255 [Streptomyces sp. S1A1-8]QDO27810.1 hypothetical protein FNV63_06245 [Streptomyces sp. S1A1-3]
MVIMRMGIEAADGFPCDAFDRAYYEAVVRAPGIYSADLHAGVVITEVKTQITTALQAVLYRHRRARETALELTDLVKLPREDRLSDWNFTTQTRLFEFFVSLHSAFESSFYGLYFAGSRLDRQRFTFADDPEKYQRVTGKSMTEAFQVAWPNDVLTKAMSDLRSDPFYDRLGKVRNRLAHRIAPGFEHRITLHAEVGVTGGGSLTGRQEGETYELAWLGEPLATMVPSTLAQAEEKLGVLWDAAAAFFASRH